MSSPWSRHSQMNPPWWRGLALGQVVVARRARPGRCPSRGRTRTSGTACSRTRVPSPRPAGRGSRPRRAPIAATSAGDGVHPRVDVGVGAGVVALVVHRALGVAAVHPVRRRRRGCGPVPASLPSDQIDHARRGSCRARRCARSGRGTPPPTPGRRSGCPASRRRRSRGSPGRTRQHHPEAQLVGQVEHARVRRVVAGPDRVDVVPLHQRSGRRGRAPRRTPGPRSGWVSCRFMPRKIDRAAVDQQPVAVDRARCGSPAAARRSRRAACTVGVVEPRATRRVHGSTGPTVERRERRRRRRSDRSTPSSGIATVTGKRRPAISGSMRARARRA